MYSQITANKAKSATLVILFIAFVIGIGYVIGQSTSYGYGAVVYAAVFSLISALVGYYASDKIALTASRAKLVTKREAPALYNIVENLSITAGVPTPKVYIIDDPALNAFATGRDPRHASVAVTTGLLNKLEKVELEGVLAHELSHVKNFDIRLMTLVVVFVGVVTLISDFFFRSLWWGGAGGRRNQGQAIFLIVAVVLALLSPLIATLIKMAVSRKREYLADASGALLTRYPEGLARALEKIAANPDQLRVANHATAHLYISNPFKRQHFAALFSTHPPIEERIRILRGMIG